MSTANISLQDETQHIASGPQSVTLFLDGSGSYYVEDGVSPTEPAADLAGVPLNKESMYLDADQHLFVSGTGRLTVISKTQAF